jgi:hypothetical protein
MAIKFACGCGKRFTAKDDNAGRRLRCPECGTVVEVPALTAAAIPLGEPIDIPDLASKFDEDCVEAEATPPSPAVSRLSAVPPPLPPSIAPAAVQQSGGPQQSSPAPVAPTKPGPAKLGGAGFRAWLGVLSIVFILAGLVSLDRSRFDPKSHFGPRFQTDNAMGATANALEYMARQDQSSSAAQWFMLALLCWLIMSVERLRYVAERGFRNQPQSP